MPESAVFSWPACNRLCRVSVSVASASAVVGLPHWSSTTHSLSRSTANRNIVVHPAVIGQVLGIVYRTIVTHLIKKAGLTKKTAHTGAVTLIQRFGSALKLNVHFHMLFIDGVYVDGPHSLARFRWVKAPTTEQLTQLAHTIAYRVGRYLERQGLLERDAENRYLAGEAVDDDPMTQLLGHSMTSKDARMPLSTGMCESGHVSHRRRASTRPQGVHPENLALLRSRGPIR